MKKFLKLALIAIIALVNNNVFAQETASTEMNLYGLKDKVWQVGQSLDGVSYTDEASEIEISFSKGDGNEDPTFIEYDTKKNGVISWATNLTKGNSLTLKTTKHTITEIKFDFTFRSNSAQIKNDKPNYEFTATGDFTYEKPTWKGYSGSVTLKNIKKGAIQVRKLTITYLDGVSGIEKVTTINVKKDNKVYDLSGNYISNDINTVKAGIYVVNGKKVVKK